MNRIFMCYVLDCGLLLPIHMQCPFLSYQLYLPNRSIMLMITVWYPAIWCLISSVLYDPLIALFHVN